MEELFSGLAGLIHLSPAMAGMVSLGLFIASEVIGVVPWFKASGLGQMIKDAVVGAYKGIKAQVPASTPPQS